MAMTTVITKAEILAVIRRGVEVGYFDDVKVDCYVEAALRVRELCGFVPYGMTFRWLADSPWGPFLHVDMKLGPIKIPKDLEMFRLWNYAERARVK